MTFHIGCTVRSLAKLMKQVTSYLQWAQFHLQFQVTIGCKSFNVVKSQGDGIVLLLRIFFNHTLIDGHPLEDVRPYISVSHYQCPLKSIYEKGPDKIRAFLCNHFNISNPFAHRAMSDVLATYELYKILYLKHIDNIKI